MDIYFATENPNKLDEFFYHLKSFPLLDINVKTIKDLSSKEQEEYQPVEDGGTFQENSLIKAKALFKILKKNLSIASKPFYVMAEDSGLEVDVLQGRPGIHSARYGETSSIRNKKLLSELIDIPQKNRTARFIASLVFLDHFQNNIFFMGKSEGLIALKEMGDNGFGYDPIFFNEASQKTFAQMSKNEKLEVSHRGKALNLFFAYLAKLG